MTDSPGSDCKSPSFAEWLMVIVIGSAVAAVVWYELLFGGGLVGGDTYPYFFPQKQMMSEAFARGETPLWHDRTSLGYPLHAESQAGVFYPTNQILYRITDVNFAYNISVVLHYVAAFVMTWRFGRSQGLSTGAAVLAATAFVYGWFPARLSLEWSIIGGVWFPTCLWLTQRLLSKPGRARWCLLAAAFAIHLLAGHFTLAFITQLTCLAFAVFVGLASRRSVTTDAAEQLSEPDIFPRRLKAVGLVATAIAFAVTLASIQLIPTFELRQLSQRDGSNAEFNPGYGHMPPVYLTQLVASWWFWHTPEMVVTREMCNYPILMSSATTNQVEAHLYVGLIPFLLLFGLFNACVRHFLRDANWKIWLVLSAMATVYSFGWLVSVFRHLPGFGFFMGPGRYTIVTALGLSLTAGLVLDALQRKQRQMSRIVVVAVLSLITLADVLKSSQAPVSDAQIVPTPPLAGLQESWLAQTLQFEDQVSPVRLLSPGPNVGNLFGVSSAPQYLGLGPAEYFSAENSLQTQPEPAAEEFPSEEQLGRLRRFAITHVLTTEAIARPSDQLELLHAAPDAFLNRVWGRGSNPCFLYRLRSTLARTSSNPSTALQEIKYLRRFPADIEFEISLTEPATVELRELMFRGWSVTVDNSPATAETVSGFGRFVRVPAGTHLVRWSYRPSSFNWGIVISSVAALAAVLILIIPVRRSVTMP